MEQYFSKLGNTAFLTFALIWANCALAAPRTAPELRVCAECALKTITQALAAAPSGSTIRVAPGRYTDAPIVIDKTVALLAEKGAVLDSEGRGDVITINGASNVRIEGFELRGSGFSYTKELAGIKIESAKNCVLKNNTLARNSFGIYLAASEGCRVEGNRITGIPKTETDTGNGIHIWQGSHHVISGNEISESRDGIYFEFVSDSRIDHNHSHDNIRYGLHFMSSNRDAYTGNVFTRNGAGVAVMYSRKIEMIDNEFSHNQGTAAYGLLLKEIFDSVIRGNRVVDNSVGIYMEGSNRSAIENNYVARNGWALKIMGSCENNVFTNNDFSGNTFDAATNSSFSDNEFRKNHWSSYNGYDLNHDGVGDHPFRMSSLSSIIVERVDSSFILLHSFLFTLFDEIERALPELTSERLMDTEPLMKSPLRNEARR